MRHERASPAGLGHFHACEPDREVRICCGNALLERTLAKAGHEGAELHAPFQLTKNEVW